MRAFKPVLLKTVQTWCVWSLEILVSPFPVPRVGVARTQPVPTLIPVFWVRAVRTLHQSLFPEWGQLAPSLSLHPFLFQGWWAGWSTCTALVAWGDSWMSCATWVVWGEETAEHPANVPTMQRVPAQSCCNISLRVLYAPLERLIFSVPSVLRGCCLRPSFQTFSCSLSFLSVTQATWGSSSLADTPALPVPEPMSPETMSPEPVSPTPPDSEHPKPLVCAPSTSLGP